ncbi:MAG: hypothetical protein K1W40_05975 [Schaedlerella sp.]|uniref:hypothetical protein n=1 Tax=Schaedlerella sp. TaxID=2676057 RepID=UPI002627273C|nr:hypothetical protein [uncultured Schaedlerella sp.]
MEKEQLKTIMTPEFMQELMDLETAEDVQKAMEQKGISLSIPEINKLQSMLESQASGEGELSESDLEEVAGGGLVQTLTDFFLDGVDAMNRWTRRRW